MTRADIEEELNEYLPVDPREYISRPPALRAITPLPAAETFYLGHITGEAIEKRRMQSLLGRQLRHALLRQPAPWADGSLDTSRRDTSGRVPAVCPLFPAHPGSKITPS